MKESAGGVEFPGRASVAGAAALGDRLQRIRRLEETLKRR